MKIHSEGQVEVNRNFFGANFLCKLAKINKRNCSVNVNPSRGLQKSLINTEGTGPTFDDDGDDDILFFVLVFSFIHYFET